MGLDKETVAKLKVLGFEINCLPKMKELRKRYLELSLVRHPDKENGSDEAFQILLNAYIDIGKLIENSKNCDIDDKEENVARKEFKENNFEKVNKT